MWFFYLFFYYAASLWVWLLCCKYNHVIVLCIKKAKYSLVCCWNSTPDLNVCNNTEQSLYACIYMYMLMQQQKWHSQSLTPHCSFTVLQQLPVVLPRNCQKQWGLTSVNYDSLLKDFWHSKKMWNFILLEHRLHFYGGVCLIFSLVSALIGLHKLYILHYVHQLVALTCVV